jgi:hypothetical protein
MVYRARLGGPPSGGMGSTTGNRERGRNPLKKGPPRIIRGE